MRMVLFAEKVARSYREAEGFKIRIQHTSFLLSLDNLIQIFEPSSSSLFGTKILVIVAV